MEKVLREADLATELLLATFLHPVLDKTTYHLVNKERLAMMKKEAVLVKCIGLDVFEEEPFHETRLADMKNAIVVPHIASAFKVTN
ncbi:BnaCnng60240D [Brassica napus]|uniref:BnaCnng60240D protein n=2 Tax=Brassica TaxID=3705 RepID=A0A078JPJ9_BRANA|nr:BnaCnng60240D [Brassica napus]VDD22241.1 unnamed protein product [Brassica oleracea]